MAGRHRADASSIKITSVKEVSKNPIRRLINKNFKIQIYDPKIHPNPKLKILNYFEFWVPWYARHLYVHLSLSGFLCVSFFLKNYVFFKKKKRLKKTNFFDEYSASYN